MATLTEAPVVHSGAELRGSALALEVALGRRDAASRDHGVRVSRLAVAVGQRLSLPPDELESLACAARLADVGRIGLPDSVLHKAGSLDTAEWELLAEHPAIGAAMLTELPDAAAYAPIVRAHHERWDGEGYPDGLAGDRIPVGSRIIAACDALVAMTSERPYRSAMDRETALQQVRADAGTQFDPGSPRRWPT